MLVEADRQVALVAADVELVRDAGALVRQARAAGATAGADLVVCPELSLVGYPPEDLVLRPAFVRAAATLLDELVRESRILEQPDDTVGCRLMIAAIHEQPVLSVRQDRRHAACPCRDYRAAAGERFQTR